MGKQINYYMGYNDFIKLAQVALDSGCYIIKEESGKVMLSDNLNLVTEDNLFYFFADSITDSDLNQNLSTLSYNGKIIEARFSKIEHNSKYITRGRIYVGSGMYTSDGEYISRNDNITKLYNKLSRVAKKLAPYTELNDIITKTTNDGHFYKTVYTHKEYISSECFELWKNSGFRLE